MQDTLVNLSELTLHLKQLRDQLADFLSLLKQEKNTLKQLNVENLLDVLSSKNSSAERVELLVKDLEKTYQVTPNFLQLKKDLEAASSTTPEINSLLDEIIQLSKESQEINLANGITIQNLNSLNSQFLNLVNPTPQVNLYGSTGQTQQSKSKNTLGSA